jgi:hypothetical protein
MRHYRLLLLHLPPLPRHDCCYHSPNVAIGRFEMFECPCVRLQ